MVNTIENVTLVEIDPHNGTQKYTWGDSITNVIYLSGINRASNINIGDKGRLVYQTSSNPGSYSGLYFFVKEN
jgi:hypothetical protein